MPVKTLRVSHHFLCILGARRGEIALRTEWHRKKWEREHNFAKINEAVKYQRLYAHTRTCVDVLFLCTSVGLCNLNVREFTVSNQGTRRGIITFRVQIYDFVVKTQVKDLFIL